MLNHRERQLFCTCSSLRTFMYVYVVFPLSLSLLGVAPHCRTMYCMCVYVSCVNVNLCVCVRACVLYVYVCICECHVSMCAWLCMCDNLLCLESRQSCINTANHTTSHTLLSSYLPASDMRFTIQGGKGDGGTSQKSDVWPFWMILGHNWLHKWLRFKDGFQQRDTWSQSSQNANSKQNGFGYPHWWNSWGNIRFVLWCRGTWKGP